MIDKIRFTWCGYMNGKTEIPANVHTIPNSNMIHFIVDGHGYYNGKRLEKGQGFICRQNMVCTYFADDEDPWAYYWINVVGPGAEQLINSLNICENVFFWDIEKNIDLIKSVCYNGNKTKEREYAAIGALFTIFAPICSNSTGKKKDYVALAKEILNNNLEKSIKIEDVAKELHLSRAYLRNVFFEQMQMSPKEYLMKIRMERAEFLLKENYTVTEVALSVGYSDVLQFSKAFFKYHGLYPTQFKKRYEGE